MHKDTWSCLACRLTIFVIICSSCSHSESSAKSSAQVGQPQYVVSIISPILCSFSSDVSLVEES